MSFNLPELSYAFNALEPFIDATTMEIHYGRHHKAYVDNLNKALEGNTSAPSDLTALMAQISKHSAAVRNNGGGHYNHSLFWSILGPTDKNTSPSAALSAAIEKSFGSLEALKEKVNAAGATRFGSGWAWLCVNDQKELSVCSTPNQDNPLMDIAECKATPILGFDVWEHAYYLKYQNKRADYLAALWSVVNWDAVSQNYEAALKA